MSVITRGAKNTLRNPARTISIVVILGVATAFVLSLLIANQAVKDKTTELKESGATVLTLSPAGSQGFQGGGEPLTNADVTSVKKLANVTDVSAILSLRTRGNDFTRGTNGTFSPPPSQINLTSSIAAGTLGNRNFGDGNTAAPTTPITIPVNGSGISGDLDSSGKNYVLTSGNFLSSPDDYQALVGTDLATKNNLKVGSTFTAYSETFTVVGLFDSGSKFGNNTVLMPLLTAERLSTQSGEVSTIIVKVNSIDNLNSVQAAINKTIGSDKVDITSSAQSTTDALTSLQNIQRISLTGVVISTIAAGVIIFLVMIMIVRERRREIAVLKAIGGSNTSITMQFVTEAVVLTVLSVIVGGLVALGTSSKLTSVLIDTNTKTTTTSATTNANGQGGGFGRRQVFLGGAAGFTRQQPKTAKDLLQGVKTNIGTGVLIEGLAAVILIGALGSAIPALTIAKIRPAEVMRGE